MSSYKISLEDNNLLRIGFGEAAQNDQIVRDAAKILDDMIKNNILKGGQILKINGPASLPVAIVIAHAVAHLFEAVGVFDLKGLRRNNLDILTCLFAGFLRCSLAA